jgi:IS30 family transposase
LRARRPKVFKLEANRWLARWIAAHLAKRWSPEQIAGRLRLEHPDDPRWWVSAETIYQSLFVQGRGGLAEELT